MGIKVERKVDTVIVEMDISMAEKVSELLFLVQDDTRMARSHNYGWDVQHLRVALEEDADVRFPAPGVLAEAKDGYVLLTDRNSESESYRRAYEAHNDTLDKCGECGAEFKRHYMSCPTLPRNRKA